MKNEVATRRTKIQRTITVLCLIFGVALPLIALRAATLPDHKYPRTAAFFLKSSPFSEEEIQTLAQFQVVVLDIQNQITNPKVMPRLRALNPSITILGYTSGVEYPLNRLNEVELPGWMWHQIGEGLQPEWFLKTADGKHLSAWPGNVMMNPGARDATGKTYGWYFAEFLKRKVLDTGLWDGLFFDTIWEGIYWLNPNVDIDRDSVRDEKEKVDQMWRDGQNIFFESLRLLTADRYLLVGNGVLAPYATYVNGRMFEGFPEPYEGGWVGSVERYRDVSKIGVQPHITIINSDTKNTGNRTDWKTMRYGLATALLFDGYYNFDYGTKERGYLWRYDEYDVSLGKPSSFIARNLLDGTIEKVAKGLWRRDFQHGMVLVNSTDTEQSIRLDEEFERLHGTQDKVTNDGSITTRVTLPPESGLLLLRPIEAILGSPYANGAFARIFNRSGVVARTGFFAYEQGQRGGTTVARRDLDRDGKLEMVVGEVNRVEIRNADGSLRTQFFPYGESASYGIRFGFGDFDRDGKDEIVTVPTNGGGAEVKIYRMDGTFVRAWKAFVPSFKGGASVAIGDLDGDGALEIVVGAGAGGGPQVRVFRPDGSVWYKGWYAYMANFRGGVNVAVGDIDGDGRSEVITGAGRGGGPHVRVFSGKGVVVHSGFFAFTPTKREGVDVLANDFDGDGKAEIVALSTNVFTTAQLFRR